MTQRPFPVDTKRTAIAIGYKNNNLIADRVLPYETVPGEKFSYLKHTLAEGFSIPDTKVGRKSDPNNVSFTAEEVTAQVEAFGLSDFIPQSDIDNAPENYDPVNRSVVGIMDLILLDREKRVADFVLNKNNYASNKKVLTTAERFGTETTGLDPYDVISNAIDAMIMNPNKCVIGSKLWNYLKKCDSLTKAYFGDANSGKVLKPQEFAELFELNELIVGTSMVNTAKRGQAVSLAKCWGSKILLMHQNTASVNSGTFGFTARHGDRVVDTQEVKKKGLKGGTEVWAGEHVKEIMCSEPHGYLIDNCIAD
nr:hypothetical protein 11 [bacterium]